MIFIYFKVTLFFNHYYSLDSLTQEMCMDFRNVRKLPEISSLFMQKVPLKYTKIAITSYIWRWHRRGFSSRCSRFDCDDDSMNILPLERHIWAGISKKFMCTLSQNSGSAPVPRVQYLGYLLNL